MNNNSVDNLYEGQVLYTKDHTIKITLIDLDEVCYKTVDANYKVDYGKMDIVAFQRYVKANQ